MENKKPVLHGAAVALAVAGLMNCTIASAETSAKTGVKTSSVELAHCYGVNKCNGHNDCKTAEMHVKAKQYVKVMAL